jgi:hypothetical protein
MAGRGEETVVPLALPEILHLQLGMTRMTCFGN